MMNTQKVISDYGIVMVDGNPVRWSYSHRVMITIHEKTETFSCEELGGNPARMCLHDLKTKCRQKFRAAAVAEARRKYVEKIDAERRAEEEANAVKIDIAPKTVNEAFN